MEARTRGGGNKMPEEQYREIIHSLTTGLAFRMSFLTPRGSPSTCGPGDKSEVITAGGSPEDVGRSSASGIPKRSRFGSSSMAVWPSAVSGAP
jgi:hypothetical protein